jgi:hypothetical protein
LGASGDRALTSCALSAREVFSFAARQALVGGIGGMAGDAASQAIGLAMGTQTGGFNLLQMLGAGVAGAYSAAGTYAAMRNIMSTCFAAGTPLRTPDGAKAIEDFRPGDLVLSRDECADDGAVCPKPVEAVFVRQGLIWHLHVGGQVIRTTAEHPFYIRDRGWVACDRLATGDTLLTEDGRWVPVEDILDTGEWETVYNLRVADFHTYFVGCAEWGFAVWAHNAFCTITQEGNDTVVRDQRTGVELFRGSAQAARDFVHSNPEHQQVLTREEGQQVIDQASRRMNPNDRSLEVVALTENSDGTYTITTVANRRQGADGPRENTVRRDAYNAAQAELTAILGPDAVNGTLLNPSRRGTAGYVAMAYRILPNYETGFHAEGRGAQQAYARGLEPVRQWSSLNPDLTGPNAHGGAACNGCAQMQRDLGIINETGFQNQGGRFDRGGVNPDWNQ